MPNVLGIKRNCFIVWFVLLASVLFVYEGHAQNPIDLIGVSGNPSAYVAYSLRKLSSTYSGFVVRVRRSNDNAEADISFDGTGKVSLAGSTATIAVVGSSGLTIGSTSTFAAFIGANNGYVSQWYNQSGTGTASASNATTSAQPRIVLSGTYLGYLENENSAVATSLTGTIANFTNNSEFTILAAFKKLYPLVSSGGNLTPFYSIGTGGGTRYTHGVLNMNTPVSAQTQIVTRPSFSGAQPTLAVPFALDVAKPFLLTSTQIANSSNDGTIGLYINDVFLGSPQASVINSFAAANFSPINSVFSASLADVQLYEMIIIDSKLSTGDIALSRANIMTEYPGIRDGYPMVYYPTSISATLFTSFNFARNAAITTLTPSYYSGAAAATSFAISPALPTGLSFNTTTGQISGTPTVTAPLTQYTITATNANGSWPAYLGFQVLDPPSNLAYATPKIFEVGVPITTLVPTSSGGAISAYSISPSLPGGLSLSGTTGTITGTPTISGVATNYTITGTNGAGSTGTNLNITVNAAFQPGTVTGGGSGGTESVCAGITPTGISSTNAASGGIGVISYQWQKSTTSATSGYSNIAGATAASYAPPAESFASTTSVYFRRAASTPNNATKYSNVHTISYRGVLLITSQPASVSVCNNTTTSLTVTSTSQGSNTHQWYSSNINSNSSGSPISGATSAIYTVPATTTPGTVYYYVIVTKPTCGTSVTSNAVAVTNRPVLTIQTQPTLQQDICNNTTGSLSVTATGGSGALSYTYQWYSNTTNSNIGGTSIVLNATSSSYTVPATTTVGSRYYYVVVTDGGCGGTLTSTAAQINTKEVLSISTQPVATQTICNNVTGSLSVTAAGASGALSYTYQWYSNTTNSNTGGTPIALNASSATYTVPATTTAGNRYYYVVVTDGGGCGSITSMAATVSTQSALAINAQSANLAICNNTTTNLSVTATGASGALSYTYQWYSNTTNSNTGGTPIALNASTDTYAVPATTTAGDRYYYVVVTDGGGCGSITSTAIIVTNQAVFSIATQPITPQTLCYNVSGSLSIATVGGTVALSPTFQWFKNTTNSNSGGAAVTIVTTATGYTIPATTTGGVRYFYAIATDGGACNSIASDVVTVNTISAFAIQTQPTPAQIICNNTSTNLSVTATGASGTLSYTYQWYSNNTNSNSGGTAIALNATSSVYTVPMTTTAGDRYYYVVITDPNCGSITSNVAKVTTRAVLTVATHPLSLVTCNNVTMDITAAGAGGSLSYTYQWFSNGSNSNSGGSDNWRCKFSNLFRSSQFCCQCSSIFLCCNYRCQLFGIQYYPGRNNYHGRYLCYNLAAYFANDL